MSLLYSYSFRGDEAPEDIILDPENIPTEFESETFLGAVSFIPEADRLIEKDSKSWKASRLSPVTSAVLHLAVYEMLKTDVPPKVAINEAVELAKKYDDAAAPSFINGILNRIGREEGILGGNNGEGEN